MWPSHEATSSSHGWYKCPWKEICDPRSWRYSSVPIIRYTGNSTEQNWWCHGQTSFSSGLLIKQKPTLQCIRRNCFPTDVSCDWESIHSDGGHNALMMHSSMMSPVRCLRAERSSVRTFTRQKLSQLGCLLSCIVSFHIQGYDEVCNICVCSSVACVDLPSFFVFYVTQQNVSFSINPSVKSLNFFFLIFPFLLV